jgi:hypothetical protein
MFEEADRMNFVEADRLKEDVNELKKILAKKTD